MKITRIEAKKPDPLYRKRVAAYARVSKHSERSDHSLSAQVSYYNDIICKNPKWIFAGVYVDQFVSGTGTANREEFNRLIADCDAGLIDLIITKSVSRFARNTVDLINTVRHLKSIGIGVLFQEQNLYTLSGDGELMLTVLASFAEQESRNMSENIKWTFQKKYRKGLPHAHAPVYGYRWVGDDLIAEPEEAEVVRRIFTDYLNGKSRMEIARELNAEGIHKRLEGDWADSSIYHLLDNELYTGDLFLQKFFIDDPINKQMKRNNGELSMYIVENHHEAIIDKETFKKAQAEKLRRKELGVLANKAVNTSCFTQRIVCGKCGGTFKRITKTGADGKLHYWACLSKKDTEQACDNKDYIPEKYLKKACVAALRFKADVMATTTPADIIPADTTPADTTPTDITPADIIPSPPDNTDNFDDELFRAYVDHITVPEKGTLIFHFKDGTEKTEHWVNRTRFDRWTPEERARFSEINKVSQRKRFSNILFSSKIKCARCGLYFKPTKTKTVSLGKVSYWNCRGGSKCGMPRLREDRLIRTLKDVLGDDFESGFRETVEYILVHDKSRMEVVFVDGRRINIPLPLSK